MTPDGNKPTPETVRRLSGFAVLTGATTAAIFVQAITAGQFVSQEGKDGWITVHGVVADVAWGLALLTAVYGWLALRATHRRLVLAAAALFVVTLVQTGIGHLITDKGQDGWIAVHVPLAFVVFGLTLWLSVRTALARRAAGARTDRAVTRERELSYR
jgi:putative Ca2+/H+ antiporter (TMEM165/GDT1 family)